MISLLLTLILTLIPDLTIAAEPTSQRLEFYVSPHGNDNSPGTEALPFRTIEHARDALRNLRKNASAGQAGATIWLKDGTYELSRTLQFGPGDGDNVLYAAYKGARVRLSGGKTIPSSAFHAVKELSMLNRLPPPARGSVLQADLKECGISDLGRHRQFGHGLPVVPAPLELFWNDSALALARYPNSGAILMGDVVDTGSVPRIGDHRNIGGSFHYTDARHARWIRAQDVWLQGFFHYGFADDRIRVASIDTTQHLVRLAAPHMYGLGSGENFNEYVALNLIEELDTPGEWYVDRSAGILYLWPPAALETGILTASVVEQPLISIENTSQLALRGLTIECGRAIGVYMEGGSQNRLEDCVIRNVGTVGIMLGQGARQTVEGPVADDYEGMPVSREVGSFQAHYYRNTVWDRKAGNGHTIARCEVYGTGSGGIILGGGSKKTLANGDNTVTDTRIHDFDRRNKAGAAGICVDGCGNKIVHNEIYNGDLQAVFVRGNNHLFEMNVIHHVARNSNDASAWYLGRDPSDRGNIVRNNFFHHIGRPDRKWTMGVYCDDATCGVTITGNVFYKVASYGTVYSNGGHDIVVRNNIFIAGYGPAYQLKSMWYDFGIGEIPYFFGEKGIYSRRLTQDVNIRKPPYSDKYPELKDWLDLLPDGKTFVGMRPRRNIFDRNLLVNYEETFRLVGKYAQTEFGENYVSATDPGFVNASTMDFRLRSDAVVFKELAGFEQVPFAEMGPRK